MMIVATPIHPAMLNRSTEDSRVEELLLRMTERLRHWMSPVVKKRRRVISRARRTKLRHLDTKGQVMQNRTISKVWMAMRIPISTEG